MQPLRVSCTWALPHPLVHPHNQGLGQSHLAATAAAAGSS